MERTTVNRVATHSGNSRKLKEFSNYKKSQGNSENFDIFFTLASYDFSKNFREVYDFKVPREIFF